MKGLRKRIYLLRHAHAPIVGEDGILRHCPGHSLSEEGRAQAESVARFLKSYPIESIWSSNVKRSIETAEIIGKELGLDVKVEPGFREFSIGVIDGKPIIEVQRIVSELPGIYEFRELRKEDKFPEGESMEELDARVGPVFEKVIAQDEATHICIVAHGGVNRVLLIRLLRLPHHTFSYFHQDPACVNIIDIVDGYAFLQLLNFTPYDPGKGRKKVRFPSIMD